MKIYLGRKGLEKKKRRLRVLIRAPSKKGVKRNCLVEDVDTGEQFVRPFRGLRLERSDG